MPSHPIQMEQESRCRELIRRAGTVLPPWILLPHDPRAVGREEIKRLHNEEANSVTPTDNNGIDPH